MKNFTILNKTKKIGINSSFKYLCLVLFGSALMIQGQAQQVFQFESDQTSIPIPDNAYDGTIGSMVTKPISISGIPDGVHFVYAVNGFEIQHTWAGDLTVKLFDDAGFALGLMSRPGLDESNDDGTECCGTTVQLGGTLIFDDNATLQSENLEYLGNPVPDNSRVRPSKGSIDSYWENLEEFFGGMTPAQINGTTWYSAVGDAGGGDTGTFKSAYLSFMYDDYCVPKLVVDEHITNVTFAGINNDSFSQVEPYPAYYTDISTNDYATVKAGETYPLSVTIAPYLNDYVYAYIDWNQNNVFEANETYTVVADTDQAGPFTINIPVPTDAVLGETRMRVSINFDNSSADPCIKATTTDFKWGETEDYTVMVEEAMGINEISNSSLYVYPNPVKDILTISSAKSVDKTEVYNLTGQLVLTKDASDQINMESLPDGTYIVKVNSAGEIKTFKVIVKK